MKVLRPLQTMVICLIDGVLLVAFGSPIFAVFVILANILWLHLFPEPNQQGLPDRNRFLSTLHEASLLTVSQSGVDKCSICWDELHYPVQLRCSHINCKDCLLDWFKRDNGCPHCRKALFAHWHIEEFCVKVAIVSATLAMAATNGNNLYLVLSGRVDFSSSWNIFMFLLRPVLTARQA
jgi:hypothetical protein